MRVFWEEGLIAVYHPQMPSRVPHRLFLKRLVLQLRNNMLTYLRFFLVCFIWLGLVPFVARWIWRFYFRFGDWSVSPPPPTFNTTAVTLASTDNITETQVASDDSAGRGVLEDGFFGWLRGQDIWTSILRDCFQGQIITICLVAVFVVIFLIREWVMQNAVGVVEEPPAVARQHGVPAVRLPENNGPIEERVPGMPGREPVREDTPDTLEEAEDVEDLFGDDARELVDIEYDPWIHNPVPETDPQPAQPHPVMEPEVQGAVQNFEDIDPPRGANEFFNNEDDDLDADDFDGLWDILGMQGPIIGLLHNTVFSALMIALAVGLGVWLPFMFGKTALGALVPRFSGVRVMVGRSS